MQLVNKYFRYLSDKQKKQFEELEPLYHYWNERINLISRKDIDQLYIRHVLHSLAVAKFIEFLPASRVMDVGTGGGFPGIPLSILFPESTFLLVDSIAKKIKAVNDIITQLEISNCQAIVARAENINQKFDFIVSRAVAPLPKFFSWVKNSISDEHKHAIRNGVLYLKGGDLKEELVPFKGKYTSVDLTRFFQEDFFETKKLVHVYK